MISTDITSAMMPKAMMNGAQTATLLCSAHLDDAGAADAGDGEIAVGGGFGERASHRGNPGHVRGGRELSRRRGRQRHVRAHIRAVLGGEAAVERRLGVHQHADGEY
jgi:hypothetical protein